MPVLKRKLLLADDSITIQKVVNLTFADEGVEVITTGDGDAAMQKFVECKPDLVMVDVNMPGMDGYRICELIKQDEQTKHIPVILLVGSFEPFDDDEARRVGADDYLTKPFQSIRQLVNKVTLLLDADKNKNYSNGNSLVAISEELDAESEDTYSEQVPISTFGDFGMDDEMIQTDQVGIFPVEEDQRFEFAEAIEKPVFDPPQMYLKKPYDFEPKSAADDTVDLQTRPLTTNDFEEINSESKPEKVEDSFEFIEKPTFSTRYIIEQPKPPEEESVIVEDEPESVLDVETVEEIFHSTEENRSYFEGVEEKQENYPLSRPTALLNLDDLNLLELPMFEDETVYEDENSSIESVENSLEFAPYQPEETGETTDIQDSKYSEMPNLDEMPDVLAESKEFSEDKVVENDSPSFQFTPDLIEQIASKVAEKISERTVREIASEVTPEIIELILKKMAEEKTR